MISARRAPDGPLGRGSPAEFFQTDAAINPGDSGGPLFNMAGLLVQRIASGSPADRIGLRAGTVRATIGNEDLIVGGDVILEVEDISLAGPEGYVLARRRLTNLPPGELVTITILRAGVRLKLTGTVDR